MRDRPPVWASWRESLLETPFAVTLSMRPADFIKVLDDHPVLLAQHLRAGRSGDTDGSVANSSAAAPVHFPLEPTEPGAIDLPEIPQEGRGRPAALTTERARKIIASACRGGSVPACAAAGGVTPNTLKSWLRRKDHEAFLTFQRHYADAETYAALATLKTIMENVASNPKRAFK